MANLWVIMTGLLVLVEKEGQENSPCTVLLMRVPEGTRVADVEVPPHEPSLRHSGSQDVPIGDQDVEFFPSVNEGTEVRGRELYLPVGVELDQPLKVQAKLVGARIADDELFAQIGRVKLSGGIVRPIQIDKNWDLNQIAMTHHIFLTEALDIESNAGKPKGNRPLANGFLYWRHVDDGDGPIRIKIGDQEIFPQPLAANAVGRLPLENQEENYVVWVVNAFDENFTPADQDFDRDFYLLYTLLENQEVKRYVPVVDLNPAPGDMFPPGQCMDGYALV